MRFHFTYVLECSDDKYYIGSTENIENRITQHQAGKVTTTSKRLPVKLVYYEACLSKTLAMKRERYFKTGFGREFLRKRIGD